jgi:hypothetical protein
MKSNKQRREELKRKKHERATRREHHGSIPVDALKLAPDGSYDTPSFVQRGSYVDMPFQCVECGRSEVWTATQQKWWYEVAKGSVWTTARRCRNCRRKERERKNETRRIHLEGLERKKAKQAARTDSTG